jgi:hypothetical protein
VAQPILDTPRVASKNIRHFDAEAGGDLLGGGHVRDLLAQLVAASATRECARACLAFAAHAHILRHGCGYALANTGHDENTKIKKAAQATTCEQGW